MTKKLYGEAFFGWKGLLADGEGGLWSPSRETFWPVGKWLKAECESKHEPPARGCGCGIYAVKTYEDLKSHHYHWLGPMGVLGMAGQTDEQGKVWVLAEVALKGQVTPAQIGYRSQKACIQTVWVPMHKLTLGHQIGERYGASVGIIDRFTGKRKLLKERKA